MSRPPPTQQFGSPPDGASPQYIPPQYIPPYEQESEFEHYDRPMAPQSEATHSGFVNQHDYDQGGFDPYGEQDQVFPLDPYSL